MLYAVIVSYIIRLLYPILQVAKIGKCCQLPKLEFEHLCPRKAVRCEGKEKVQQQVQNILCHLQKAHGMSIDCI